MANLLYIFALVILIIWGVAVWGDYSDGSIHGLLLIATISIGLRIISIKVHPLH